MGDKCRELAYCKGLESMDDVFSFYEKGRDRTLDILRNNPAGIVTPSLFHTDPGCLFRMGTSSEDKKSILSRADNRSSLTKGKVKCLGCKDITRLSGGSVGSTICYKCAGGYITLDVDSERSSQCITYTDYVRQLPRESTCNISRGIKGRVISDTFTNSLLVGWYVRSVLGDVPSRKTYLNFVCSGTGYTVSSSLLTNRRSTDAEDIFSQCAVVLDKLEHYRFDIGEGKFRYMSHTTPVSYQYKGISMSSTVTPVLVELGESSIDVIESSVRLHHSSDPDSWVMKRLSTPDRKPDVKDGLFRLGHTAKRNNYSMYKYLKSIGSPMYQSSLNVYLTMIDLMSDAEFQEEALQSEVISDFWKDLWGESFLWVQDRLPVMKGMSHKNILDIISGVYLRCDANDMMFQTAVNVQRGKVLNSQYVRSDPFLNPTTYQYPLTTF